MALALVVHLSLLWIFWEPLPKQPLGDEQLYWHAAKRVAAGENAALHPFWPPFYPQFLGRVLALSGGSLFAVQLVQTLLLVGAALLARDLCTRLSGRPRVGNAVAWLFVLDPTLVAFAHYVWPEVLHLALFTLALWILAARRSSLLWLALLGLALGTALVTKSLLGPFVPVLLVPLVREGRARQRALRVAVVLLVLGATLAPAVATSYRRDGTLGLGGSAWFNAWVGLNDHSRKSHRGEIVLDEFERFEASAPDFAARNAILRERIVDLLRERGIAHVLAAQLGRQYFRLFDKDSFLTDQLPGGAAWRDGFGYANAPRALAEPLRLLSYAVYAAVLVGAALGIALLPVRGRPWLAVALAFVAYNLAILLVLHVKSRYRIPLLPFLYFFAALALDTFRERPTFWRELSRGRTLAGAAAAALMLFLAFGGPLLDGS